MTNAKLRAKLAGALAAKGMSKADVARRTSIPYSTLTKAFREPRSASVAHLMRICEVLELEVVFGETE